MTADEASARALRLRPCLRADREAGRGWAPAGGVAGLARALAEQLRRELPNASHRAGPGRAAERGRHACPGSAPAIVVGAHYDTEATMPGSRRGQRRRGRHGRGGRGRQRARSASCRPSTARSASSSSTARRSPPAAPTQQFAAAARCAAPRPTSPPTPARSGEMILLDYVANTGLQHPPRGELGPGALAAAAGGRGRWAPRSLPRGGRWKVRDHRRPRPVHPGGRPVDRPDRLLLPVRGHREDTPDKLDPAALDAVGEAVTELVLELATESQ